MADDKRIQYLIEFLVKLKGSDFAVKAVKDMTKSVADSEKAMNKYNKALETGNQKQKESKSVIGSWVTDMKNVMKNALAIAPAWLMIRQGILTVVNAIKGGVDFLKDWEYQLAQIKMTGGATDSEIRNLGIGLLSLSKNLGISNKELGDTAKLIIQQGRAVNEVLPMVEAVARFSMLTGKSMEEGLDGLTAVLEGFNKKVSESASIIDALEKVELNHAITVDVLASGIEQVAAIANEFNITFEETLGIITAVHETTRDKGSKIGQMWKTIFTRMNTDAPKALQSIAHVTTYLDDFGKESKIATNNMIPMSQRLIDLALKWNKLSEAEKSHLTNILGGKRAINIIIAYLQNYSEALRAEADALFSAGEATKATSVLTETFKNKIESVSQAWNIFMDSMLDSEPLKKALDIMKEFIDTMSYFLKPERVNYQDRTKFINQQNKELEKQLALYTGIETAYGRMADFAAVAKRTPEAAPKVFKAVQQAYFPKLKETFPEIEKVSDFKQLENFMKTTRPELEGKKQTLKMQQIRSQMEVETLGQKMELTSLVRKQADIGKFAVTNVLKTITPGLWGTKLGQPSLKELIDLRAIQQSLQGLNDLTDNETKRLIEIFRSTGNKAGMALIDQLRKSTREKGLGVLEEGTITKEFQKIQAETRMSKIEKEGVYGYSPDQIKTIETFIEHELEIAKSRGALEQDQINLKYNLRELYGLEIDQLAKELEIEKAILATEEKRKEAINNGLFYNEERTYQDEENRYIEDIDTRLKRFGIKTLKERNSDFDTEQSAKRAEQAKKIEFKIILEGGEELYGDPNLIINNPEFKDKIKKIVAEGISEEIDEKRGW